MDRSDKLVVFQIDDQRYALHLAAVERVFRSVAVTPLPKAPEIVLGVVNIQGRVLPVVNMRKRFRLPERDIGPDDRFIVADTLRRSLIVVADSVDGVVEPAIKKVIKPENLLQGLGYIDGIVTLPDGMILIHDLERFLSLEEETLLDHALQQATELSQ